MYNNEGKNIMKIFNINSFRGSGKTTNAIAMAVTFAACGKKVDFLVPDTRSIRYIKDKIKTKYGINTNIISVLFDRGYTHSADTDVVICDECSYPVRGVDSTNLVVLEYNTPIDFELFTYTIPNFMHIYGKIITDRLDFKAPVFNTHNEEPEKSDVELLTDKIGKIKCQLDCTVDQALEIIKFERGI